MNNKVIFALSGLGLAAGVLVAYMMSAQPKPAAPLFAPSANPYAAGIYAEGIVESAQGSGENMNVYADVSGVVTRVWVKEGQTVKSGQALLEIDRHVQEATTEQLRLQAQAAHDSLAQLRAQPRREQLEVIQAQLRQAQASERTLQRQYDKLHAAQLSDAGAVSRESVDSAEDQLLAAKAATALAQRQLDLSRAGAWSYDIKTQVSQTQAADHAYASAKALLDRFTLKAPSDGVVMAINAAQGGWASSAGVYETYTESQVPLMVLSHPQDALQVRCYVDEILIPRLPSHADITAQLSVRGSDTKIPLKFERIQPYVSPKIELSDARQERVDLRVLPVIFRFATNPKTRLYPGQLVDVYIQLNANANAATEDGTPHFASAASAASSHSANPP